MFLNTYEDIARHLHFFSHIPLYVSRVDKPSTEIKKVSFNSSNGLIVETVTGELVTVNNNVYSDMKEEDFRPKIKGGKKDAKTNRSVPKKTKDERNTSKTKSRKTLK